MDDIDYESYVIKSYFDSNKYYLTKHHIESYNDFILNKILRHLTIQSSNFI